MPYAEGSFTEPDWLAELKEYARITHTGQDTLLTRHLQSAREWFERHARVITAQRQITLTLDRFPAGAIEVCRLPVASVASVQYRDGDDVLQTLDASKYVVSLGDERHPCRIAPAIGESWPTVRGDFDDVVVTFTAGYSPLSDMPSRMLDPILSYARDLFDEQGGVSRRTDDLLTLAQWRHV